MDPKVSSRQLDVLAWIADGCAPGRWEDGDYTYKLTTKALQNRGLARSEGAGKKWQATATDAGLHYLQTGSYPAGHRLSHLSPPVDAQPVPEAPRRTNLVESAPPRKRRKVVKRDHYVVDSPLKYRTRTDTEVPDFVVDDPWETKILVTVKEAAWALSVSEELIREAVRDDDIDRVFIGQGDTRYRIVYQSLLAWVNSMPTTSPRAYW